MHGNGWHWWCRYELNKQAYFKVDATFYRGGLCMDCVAPLHIAVQLAKWRSEQQSEFKNIGSSQSLEEFCFLHSSSFKNSYRFILVRQQKDPLQLVKKTQKVRFSKKPCVTWSFRFAWLIFVGLFTLSLLYVYTMSFVAAVHHKQSYCDKVKHVAGRFGNMVIALLRVRGEAHVFELRTQWRSAEWNVVKKKEILSTNEYRKIFNHSPTGIVDKDGDVTKLFPSFLGRSLHVLFIGQIAHVSEYRSSNFANHVGRFFIPCTWIKSPKFMFMIRKEEYCRN